MSTVAAGMIPQNYPLYAQAHESWGVVIGWVPAASPESGWDLDPVVLVHEEAGTFMPPMADGAFRADASVSYYLEADVASTEAAKEAQWRHRQASHQMDGQQ